MRRAGRPAGWSCGTSFLALAAGVLAQGTGRVEGTVVNGTDGGVPAGVEVTLFRYDPHRGRVLSTLVTTADDRGSFVFEGVPGGDEAACVPQATYKGVEYAPDSGITRVRPGETARFSITVYETSEEIQGLEVTADEITLLLEQKGWITVVERITLHNPGKTTWVGKSDAGGEHARHTAEIPLPPGVDDRGVGIYPESLEGGVHSGVVVLHGALQPGPTTVTLQYGMRLGPARLPVRRPLPYGARSVLLAHPKELTVEAGSDLRPLDHPHTGLPGVDRFLRSARAYAPGEAFSFAIVFPASGWGSWVLIFGGSLLLGSALLFFQRRAREDLDPAATLRAEREALLRKVARLDRALAEGRIARRAHRQKREGQLRVLLMLEREVREAGEGSVEQDRAGRRERQPVEGS